ncbi:uncharacterized protein LOC131531654 [Onychostoma macrolepis]|nr:uncharacterized protein LOC131531654 [Onychostoma macrolepis]
MITPDTMSIEAREVRLEVYLNGAFYSDDSYFALDDKDVQLEFEITDAIYDLLGCSASQDVDVKLKVVTDDRVSITYCSPGEMRLQLEVDENEEISVCEVKDLQLKMNRNDSISELKSPTLVSKDLSDPAGASGEEANDQGGLDAEENRPAESTAGWMFRKMSAVFQQLSAIFQTNTLNAVGEPEVDLVDTEQSCVPDPSVPEPEPAGPSGEEANDQGGLDAEENRPAELNAGRMTKKISTVFQRFHAVFQRKMLNSVGEPEVDLIDTEQSCITDPSVSEPEPAGPSVEEANDQGGLDAEENRPAENTNMMKIKKVHGFVMTKRTEYATVRNIKKIRTFFQNDRPKHVGVSAWPEMNQNVPEPEPEDDLDDPPENEWDLAAPEESCEPGPSVPEPESKVVSELTRLENYVPLNMFQMEDRLKKCTPLKQRHVTNVWPRIFIGDGEIATDRDALQEMCITHILNAAAQKKDLNYYLGTFNGEDVVGSVNTRSRYYRDLHINYYGLPTADRCCSDISEYFMPAAKFIDKALDKRASKVLICCKQGVEHSATLFLAYLMICHDMMVEEAIDHVIKSRCIRPSRDVLKKLMLLNADLVQQRKLKLQGIKTGRKRTKGS